MIEEATLVIEARGLPEATDSVDDYQLWSKLYRAGGFFLELSCQANQRYSHLEGQLLTANGQEAKVNARVSLHDEKTQKVHQVKLNDSGQFKFELNQEDHAYLKLEVNSKVLMVHQLFA